MGYNPNSSPFMGNTTNFTKKKNGAGGGGGTFLQYCRNAKRNLHPHAITLVRCGDFYETYGIDAIMLVEHVGLNPMAGKCKAGCPYRNVQSTLDALTNAGFTVAVHEENEPRNSLKKKKLHIMK